MGSDLRASISVALLVAAAGGIVEAQQPASARLAGISRDVACAPASPSTPPAAAIKVLAGREARKRLFGIGEAVIIGGGTAQGVRTGDEYFVRRIVGDRFTELRGGKYPISIHTAGAVQIVEAQTDVSIAVITYGCDGVIEGDYLERFQPPTLTAPSIGATPDFARPGRLMLGDERRQVGAAGDFMVVDRGSDHGLRPGHQITIFRTTLLGGAGPVATIGSATVYVVAPETAVVRIERSIDAVYVGDFVAIHR